MSGIMAGIDQRTMMVGQNRMELLLFYLEGKQCYGINVFKVKEVMQCPKLTTIPHSSEIVRGVVNIRGRTIPVIDLNLALGKPAVDDPEIAYIIVTEYNRRVQGLLVNAVDRIINTNWSDIHSPPDGLGKDTFMTAVTQYEDVLIEILDVERVLDKVICHSTRISGDLQGTSIESEYGHYHVLVADDSGLARNQIKQTLDQLGIECTMARDGQEALDKLNAWLTEGGDIKSHVSLVISDVEMPRMDGYTLTNSIRQEPRLKDLLVILHTSLSGVFNNSMVEKVGANLFVPKYEPDELAKAVVDILQAKN